MLVGGSSRDEDLQKATFTTVERPLQNSIYIRTSYLIINKLHFPRVSCNGVLPRARRMNMKRILLAMAAALLTANAAAGKKMQKTPAQQLIGRLQKLQKKGVMKKSPTFEHACKCCVKKV